MPWSVWIKAARLVFSATLRLLVTTVVSSPPSASVLDTQAGKLESYARLAERAAAGKALARTVTNSSYVRTGVPVFAAPGSDVAAKST